jgi:hypothetical protein
LKKVKQGGKYRGKSFQDELEWLEKPKTKHTYKGHAAQKQIMALVLAGYQWKV